MQQQQKIYWDAVSEYNKFYLLTFYYKIIAPKTLHEKQTGAFREGHIAPTVHHRGKK